MLHTHNIRLQRLFTNVPHHSSSYRLEAPKNSHTPSTESIRQISIHANKLYDAIGMRYKCRCPVPHEATLGIRQVSPGHIDMKRPFELLYPVGECSKGQVFELEDSVIDESTDVVDADSMIARYFPLSGFLNMHADNLATFLHKFGLKKVARTTKSRRRPVL